MYQDLEPDRNVAPLEDLFYLRASIDLCRPNFAALSKQKRLFRVGECASSRNTDAASRSRLWLKPSSKDLVRKPMHYQ